MRKLRAAVVGFLVALPAALVLPAATPAAAYTTCSGTNFGTFNATIDSSTLHGTTNSTVLIDGSGFALATSFSNGGTVYFPNSSGSQTVAASNWTVANSGNSVSVSVPVGGYSGQLEICLNAVGGSYQAFTGNRYSVVPQVTSVPGSATEGSTVSLGGKFMPNQPTSVQFGCGTVVGGSAKSLTQVTATVPGYCPGPVSVTQTSYDNANLTSGAAGSLSIQPTASAVSGSTYPGQSVSVSGSGFGGGGSVTVGGANAPVSSWSDGQIVFQAPDGSEGGGVAINAPGGSTSAGSLGIYPHISGLSPSSARDGDTVTINGQDFGSSPGTVTLGGQALDSSNLSGWGMDRITFAVPAGAVPGQVGVTTADGRGAVNAANLSLVPVISSVTPTSASPGAYVTISGSTFGQNPGSVTIGGRAAQIADWADTAIIAVVPPGATSGKLVVNSGYGQSVAWGQTFTVTGGGSAGGGSTSTGYSSYTNSGTMNVKPNYGFLPLPAPPPGVAFHLTAPAADVKPGSAVPLTVSLQINNKPVAGATITFQVATSPGEGTQLSAPSAVTDQTGVAHVTLTTSKKPGQTIVIAHSGAFADQIRIVTLSPTASLGGATTILRTTSSLDPHILVPFIGALVLAVLLLLGTVVLQFVLHRRGRALAPAAAAPAPVVAADAAAVEPQPAVEAAAAAAVEPRATRPRKPRTPKAKVVRAENTPAAEPVTLDLAAGAEDIAPVIQLRPRDAAGEPKVVEPKITRTRARARARE